MKRFKTISIAILSMPLLILFAAVAAVAIVVSGVFVAAWDEEKYWWEVRF